MTRDRSPVDTLAYVSRMLRELRDEAEAAELRDLAYLLSLAQREARERTRALGRSADE